MGRRLLMNSYNTKKTVDKEPMDLSQIISNFFKALKKLWIIMVVAIIVCGFIGHHNYSASYSPNYETKATFSITAAQYDGREDRSYTNNTQLASILSVSFNYLINNEVFYEVIKKDLNIDYMPSTITISAVPDTNILSIVTAGPNPQMNYKVAQSVMKNYGSVAEFVIGDTKLDVLEEPVVAEEPTNPYSPWKQTIIYAFIGLLIGIVPSIIYGFFVRTIRNREDVEKYLNVNFLGILPGVSLNQRKNKLKNCSILNKAVGFRYLEAMRSVNSRCEREFAKHNAKVILVTSTVKGEGKSTVALNLAYSLSKSQHTVMLIDGNLRTPTLHKMVDMETYDFQMDSFLKGELKSSGAIVNLKGTRVLMLAPTVPSKDPIKQLNSEAMGNFINNAKAKVDYVIIDAPPCSELSDAAVLAKHSDGVIYVVKEDYAKVNKIIDTIQEFSYTRIPILGCILNGSAGKLNITYGYNYGKHYGYGYRKGYGSKYYGKYGYNYYSGYGTYGDYDDEENPVPGGYGKVSEKEFGAKEQSVSNKIYVRTTDRQKEKMAKKEGEKFEKYAEKMNDKDKA